MSLQFKSFRFLEKPSTPIQSFEDYPNSGLENDFEENFLISTYFTTMTLPEKIEHHKEVKKVIPKKNYYKTQLILTFSNGVQAEFDLLYGMENQSPLSEALLEFFTAGRLSDLSNHHRPIRCKTLRVNGQLVALSIDDRILNLLYFAEKGFNWRTYVL